MDITTQPQVEEILAPPQAEEQAVSEATPAEPMAEQQPTAEPTTFELEVKYNKEQRKLTREEAIEYAQKGMNYGKLQERLESIQTELERAKKAQAIFDEMSAETGRPYDEVIALTARQRLEAKAKKEGKPLGQLEAEIRAEKADARAAELESEQKTRERHAQEKADFEAGNPDVDVATLPDEVLEDWLTNGTPLTKAYKVFKADEAQKTLATLQADYQSLQERVKQMDQKEKAEQINAANAEASPGRLGEGATAEMPLSEEVIDKMTPEEKVKNHAKIWAYLTGQKK